jgi:hypothetical protein
MHKNTPYATLSLNELLNNLNTASIQTYPESNEHQTSRSIRQKRQLSNKRTNKTPLERLRATTTRQITQFRGAKQERV